MSRRCLDQPSFADPFVRAYSKAGGFLEDLLKTIEWSAFAVLFSQINANTKGAPTYALILAVIPPGLWLAAHSAPGLILVGAVGLCAAWAYSARPFKLQARGLGKFGITAAWTLVVVGADFVERGQFCFMPFAAGLGFALLVANVLYINQFPDLRADALSGNRTMVVRPGAAKARWG
jgi:1,4-dihydroxy-2-naphthoate octaprenyltransferase